MAACSQHLGLRWLDTAFPSVRMRVREFPRRLGAQEKRRTLAANGPLAGDTLSLFAQNISPFAILFPTGRK